MGRVIGCYEQERKFKCYKNTVNTNSRINVFYSSNLIRNERVDAIFNHESIYFMINKNNSFINTFAYPTSCKSKTTSL